MPSLEWGFSKLKASVIILGVMRFPHAGSQGCRSMEPHGGPPNLAMNKGPLVGWVI